MMNLNVLDLSSNQIQELNFGIFNGLIRLTTLDLQKNQISHLDALSNIKIILKDGLKKIPGAGWAMQTALFIFIKRKWEVDKEIFTKFINYYKQIEKKAYVN